MFLSPSSFQQLRPSTFAAFLPRTAAKGLREKLHIMAAAKGAPRPLEKKDTDLEERSLGKK